MPADLVMLVGICGNISADDVRRTLAVTAEWVKPGATLIWTNNSTSPNFALINEPLNDDPWSPERVGHVPGSTFAGGVATFTGKPQAFVRRQKLFTFFR